MAQDTEDVVDTTTLVEELADAWPTPALPGETNAVPLPTSDGAAAAIEAVARSLAGKAAGEPRHAPYQKSWEDPAWLGWHFWEEPAQTALVAGLRQLGLTNVAEVVAASPLSTR